MPTLQITHYAPAAALEEARRWVRDMQCGEDLLPFVGPLLAPETGDRFVVETLKWRAMQHPFEAADVCNIARAGWGQADQAIRELIAEITNRHEPVPAVLAAYNVEVLSGRYPRIRGRHHSTREFQDIAIFVLVYGIIAKYHLQPTRRANPKGKVSVSACDIVWQALRDAGINRGGPQSIEKIWRHQKRRAWLPDGALLMESVGN